MIFRLTTLLILFSLAAPASADITDLYVNAYTDNRENGGQSLHLWVEFKHTSLRPPDAVAILQVTAPDGTVIVPEWEEFWKGFGAYLSPDDFVGGSIPTGNYKFQVKEKGGAFIVIKDYVTATMLDAPSVTSPINGMVGSLTPTIAWTPIAGAQHYRFELYNVDWNEPVYGTGRNLRVMGSTSFTIPNAVLRPGTTYRVRIRAGDEPTWSAMDKQSRSNWVNFTTPP